MFFPFPILAFLAYDPYTRTPWQALAALVSICAFGGIFAGCTELIQEQLTYRSKDINDFGADCLAIGIASLLTFIIDVSKMRKKKCSVNPPPHPPAGPAARPCPPPDGPPHARFPHDLRHPDRPAQAPHTVDYRVSVSQGGQRQQARPHLQQRPLLLPLARGRRGLVPRAAGQGMAMEGLHARPDPDQPLRTRGPRHAPCWAPTASPPATPSAPPTRARRRRASSSEVGARRWLQGTQRPLHRPLAEPRTLL